MHALRLLPVNLNEQERLARPACVWQNLDVQAQNVGLTRRIHGLPTISLARWVPIEYEALMPKKNASTQKGRTRTWNRRASQSFQLKYGAKYRALKMMKPTADRGGRTRSRVAC